MLAMQRFFATCPRGAEPLLLAELEGLEATALKETAGGVYFQGDMALGYRACLWLRTAGRVLLLLHEFPAGDAEALYQGVQAVDWQEHIAPDGTLWVDWVGTGGWLSHSRFGAQKVKDAIVDQCRARSGVRPSVVRENPQLRLNLRFHREQASLAVDLSGEALHRRGYRWRTGEAPLKEHLAAALLLKVGWPALAATGAPLIDPMCGSGTLLIEAALMASDRAPGLLRGHWGFEGWLQHRPALWKKALQEARERAKAGSELILCLIGHDQDDSLIQAAITNAGRAGVGEQLQLSTGMLADAKPPSGAPGLFISNPPYGERLSGSLEQLYGQLGEVLRQRFGGWQAAVFTGNPELGKRMGLRAQRTNRFYNGALSCRLLQFQVQQESFVDQDAAAQRLRARRLSAGEPFANRLRKNLRTLGRWAKRQHIHCYRLYDGDIPEYAVAVDCYGDHLHVQAYAPPRTVDETQALERLEQVRVVLGEVFAVAPESIPLKLHRQQRGGEQYQRQDRRGEFLNVTEGQAQFLVNLHDYLDTGLYLDHRGVRAYLAELAAGRDFLNLYAYTATASVQAALAGARSTTSVDLSKTYQDWAAQNLALNGLATAQHRLIRGDCQRYLAEQQGRVDVIFLNPPSRSRSSAMEQGMDLYRDHPRLIVAAYQRLRPGGVLVFSTHARGFSLDIDALGALQPEEISQAVLPRDFQRRQPFQAFRFQRPH